MSAGLSFKQSFISPMYLAKRACASIACATSSEHRNASVGQSIWIFPASDELALRFLEKGLTATERVKVLYFLSVNSGDIYKIGLCRGRLSSVSVSHTVDIHRHWDKQTCRKCDPSHAGDATTLGDTL